jgi:hypothetical protein
MLTIAGRASRAPVEDVGPREVADRRAGALLAEEAELPRRGRPRPAEEQDNLAAADLEGALDVEPGAADELAVLPGGAFAPPAKPLAV